MLISPIVAVAVGEVAIVTTSSAIKKLLEF